MEDKQVLIKESPQEMINRTLREIKASFGHEKKEIRDRLLARAKEVLEKVNLDAR